MNLQETERKIWNECKKVFKNRRLRLKDLLEWSTGRAVVEGHLGDDEVIALLPQLGVWVAVKQSDDKRERPTNGAAEGGE